jgi:hypothetical protein
VATIPTTRRDSGDTKQHAPRECRAEDCAKEARCAIRTLRPNRGTLYSVFYFDDRTAPRLASPYCKAHGMEVMSGSMAMLVDEDRP